MELIVGSYLYVIALSVMSVFLSPLGRSIEIQVVRTVHGPQGSCEARMNSIESQNGLDWKGTKDNLALVPCPGQGHL